MTDSDFYAFIKRILENGSNEKSRLSLEQFKKILELQSAESRYIEDIEHALKGLPEAKDFAKVNATISSKDLKLAENRAEIRRLHEQKMASRYGRC